jgi:thiamine kinase-like enzyme
MAASIVKVCRTNRAFIKERFVYESAFPYKPKLIEIQQLRTLILSKVEGIPYLDTPELTDEMVIKLAKAIGKLHSVSHIDEKVLCHWDNQPRNILWDEKKQRIFLIDFEDIRLAPPEADLAHLFLFWAETVTSDVFQEKVCLFICNYKSAVKLNQARWKLELRKAKSRFDSRRRRYCKEDKTTNPCRLVNRKSLLVLRLDI